MPPYDRPSPTPPTFRGSPFGPRMGGLLPWMFIVGIAVAVVMISRHGLHWPDFHADTDRARDTAIVLQQEGGAEARQAVDVIRTIDGDTFMARVHQREGRDLVTRVRLRGIDAPELKASCQDELVKAEAATEALRQLLGQGGVAIYNIGPDKYEGRIVADVATRRTANVSAALLASGHVRPYQGGHRDGWCGRGWRFWQ